MHIPGPESVQNYVQLHPVMVSGMTTITICLHMRTDLAVSGTLFSYATEQSRYGNGVVLYGTSNQRSFTVIINGAESPWIDLRVLDADWHHVCLTWKNNGLVRLFTDGQRMTEQYGLGVGHVINPGGVFILGQDQDWVGGGFDFGEGYLGHICNLNMWNRVLNLYEMAEANNCRLYGNVIDWRDVQVSLYGAVEQYYMEECAATNIVDDGCPVGYRLLLDTCVRLSSDGVSHDVATQACLSESATLAMPKTREFDLALRELVMTEGGNGQYWIGLWEGTAYTDWQWIDGTALHTYDYQGWNPGEPSNTRFLWNICVSYWSGPRGYPMWDDGECFYDLLFICQTSPL
ncbi:C-reactive protein-like [Branchiostoma floridae x Branchiostoma japonicum]